MTANWREIVSLTVTSVLPQARIRFRESQLVDKSAARIPRTQLGTRAALRETGERGGWGRRAEGRDEKSEEFCFLRFVCSAFITFFIKSVQYKRKVKKKIKRRETKPEKERGGEREKE